MAKSPKGVELNPRDTGDYEGKQDHIREDLGLPLLEVWKNQYPDLEYEVHHAFGEFTCVCPKTGLPDFAELELIYTPDELCVELKSFKLYLVGYRDIGIFHEHAVNRILRDFVTATKPRQARLQGKFLNRGGIMTTVEAYYPNIPENEESMERAREAFRKRVEAQFNQTDDEEIIIIEDNNTPPAIKKEEE